MHISAAYPFVKMAGRRFFASVVRQMCQFRVARYVHAAQGIFSSLGVFFQIPQIAVDFS
jgi:hypothetical protein